MISGLVVMGRDSRGHGFESCLHLLYGYFSHLFVAKTRNKSQMCKWKNPLIMTKKFNYTNLIYVGHSNAPMQGFEGNFATYITVIPS